VTDPLALGSKTNAQWLYETTAPGSGLPLLATLKDMKQSGDVVTSVSGRFSGSISFIFSQLRDGVPLSKALAAAVAKGLCEPDPRDDLNGVDNARALVVLGRELGLQVAHHGRCLTCTHHHHHDYHHHRHHCPC
jgi:aspartokinase/homoserine dehydrogenase 1